MDKNKANEIIKNVIDDGIFIEKPNDVFISIFQSHIHITVGSETLVLSIEPRVVINNKNNTIEDIK